MENQDDNIKTQASPEEKVTQTSPKNESYYQQNNQNVENLKNLVHIAGVIALIFAILGIIGAIFTLGITLIFAIVDFLIWHFSKEINTLIDQYRYSDAKSKTMLWMIVGLVFGGLIPGILLLLAYLKFDEVMRTNPPSGYTAPPPPPQ